MLNPLLSCQERSAIDAVANGFIKRQQEFLWIVTFTPSDQKGMGSNKTGVEPRVRIKVKLSKKTKPIDHGLNVDMSRLRKVVWNGREKNRIGYQRHLIDGDSSARLIDMLENFYAGDEIVGSTSDWLTHGSESAASAKIWTDPADCVVRNIDSTRIYASVQQGLDQESPRTADIEHPRGTKTSNDLVRDSSKKA